MATKSFEELNTGALTIKNNELPESNTHTLVGNQLVDMVAKEQEIDGKVNDLATGEGSNIDILKFNPETVAQLEQIGQVRYNPATQCLEVKLNDEVTLSVGLDNYMRGKNADSIDLEAPMVVFVSGGLGSNAMLTRASNDAVLGEKVIGVITQGIAKNNIGFVATSGIVNNINTSAYAEGDVLWLGTNGTLTNVKPDVSVNQICIGVVLRSHATEGSLLVAIKDDWRGQVAQLRSDLSETTDKFNNNLQMLAKPLIGGNSLEEVGIEDGKYINENGELITHQSWRVYLYDVSDIQIGLVTGSSSKMSNLPMAALYDENDSFLMAFEVGAGGIISDKFISFFGAKYLRVNKYSSNPVGVKLISTLNFESLISLIEGKADKYSLIHLFGMSDIWQHVSTTGWQVGFIMYNTVTNLLRRAATVTNKGGVASFEDVPYIDGAIYTYNEKLFVYDGTQLVSVNASLEEGLEEVTQNISGSFETISNGRYGDELTPIESVMGIITQNGTINSGYGAWTTKKYDLSNQNIVFITGKSSSASAYAATYDENDAPIEVFGFGQSGYTATNVPLYVGKAKYIRVSRFNTDGLPILREYTSNISIKSLHHNNLAGKKVAFIGDSITAGGGDYPVDTLYHKIFANLYNCQNVNLGKWSTTIAANTTSEFAADTFVTRATAANLSDCSLIVVFGGTNDHAYDTKPIGTCFTTENQMIVPTTDLDTFDGALHNLINTIRTNAPLVPIVFMTPSLKNRSSTSNSRWINNHGNSMFDFADTIKKICNFYGIPVLDLGGISGLDFKDANIKAEYTPDGLHPNAKGHKIIGELLYRFVEQNVVI